MLYNKDQTELIRVPETRTSIVIPNTVRTIGASAFSDCTGLTSIELPVSLTSIGDRAFSGCIGLSSVDLSNVTSIGDDAFSGCADLTLTELLNVKSIGSNAFRGCMGLFSLCIGEAVISETAFSDCTNLKEVKISSGYTEFAFPYAEKVFFLQPDAIITNATDINDFSGTIYATQNVLDQFTSNNVTKVKLYSLTENAKMGGCVLSFDSIFNELHLENATCYRAGFGAIGTIERIGNEYKIVGLVPDIVYRVEVEARLDGEIVIIPIDVRTQKPYGVLTPEIVKRTQTTMEFEMLIPFDETCAIPITLYASDENRRFSSVEVECEGGYQKVKIEKLKPSASYSVFFRVIYGDSRMTGDYYYYSAEPVECSTLPLVSSFDVELTPSTAKVSVVHLEGDATVLHSEFSRNVRYTEVSSFDTYREEHASFLELTGLEPSRLYAVWYCVETEEGGKDSVSYSFTTPALEFETLPAKATSNTVALICAETNLSDRETGAGFEWRRYDAPDLVPSDQSPCPVVDGVLTGALRNLSASTYYKFRPYYTSASGETYYGEWLAFGTADAYVYFDPTVRTYEAMGVTATEARVRGYAIAGSDDITEQGFEYWPTEEASKRAATDVQRVQATGQFMTTTLEDLQPGTVYTFRVYVETAKGTTYGEEQTFTTAEGATGISTTETEADSDLQVAIRGSLSEGSASVRVNGYGGEAVWTLRSIGGATVAQGRIQTDGSWQTLDAPTLPRGIYLLTVSDGQRTRTVKLVAH